MKILFIDDDKARHEAFDAVFNKDKAVHAFDVREAIELLQAESFDEIWIDHDFDMTDSSCSGLDLARSIVFSFGHLKSTVKIKVHSMNPDGAQAIHSILTQHGFVSELRPFFQSILRKGRCRICGLVAEGIVDLCIDCGFDFQ